MWFTHKSLSSMPGTELTNTISNLFQICVLPGLPWIYNGNKCETILRDLEITQSFFLRAIKKRADRKFTFYPQHFIASIMCWLSAISPVIINAISKVSFLLWNLKSNIFLYPGLNIFNLEWPRWAFKSQILTWNSSGKKKGASLGPRMGQ